MVNLTEAVRSWAAEGGAHTVGIAPVDRFAGAPVGHHPGDLLPGARSVISFGVRFFQTVLDSHNFGLDADDMRVGVLGRVPYDPAAVKPEDSQLGYVQEFMHTQHNTIINMGLEWIAARLAYLLSEQGHGALPLPASGWPEEGYDSYDARPTDVPARPGISVPPGRSYALFSHRVAAVLAGLGDWGLNNLVITPEYGPRMRFNSVITTAELVPDPMLTRSVCLGADCKACLQSRSCWGELHYLVLGGRSFRAARFLGCKPGLGIHDTERPDTCRRGGWGTLPTMRHCVGACPVGQ